MRRSIQFLAVLLAAAMTGMVLVSAHAGTRFSPSPGAYLPSHGAPPLRFAEIIVPASPAPAQAATASSPPVSASAVPAGAGPAATDHPASTDVPVHPPATGAVTVIASSPEKSAPLSILPDEARPQVRPEDFLPYFQIPGTGRNPDVTLAVPVTPGPPAQPPPTPSSATYLQTDK